MSTDSGSHHEGEHHHPHLHALSESLHEHEESYLRALKTRWEHVQASAAAAYWTRLTATDFFIAGLGIFSSFLFSSQITSGQKTYGPAGVVLAIVSYLVGFGVCLHLGAVFGRVWNDWHAAGAQERIHEAPALRPEPG